MDGKVVYQSLKEAANDLNNNAQKLDDPIDRFIENAKKIGESGSSAWGGSAAEEVSPVLYKLKEDIAMLQSACAEFSENVETSVMNYQEADASSIKTVQDIIQG